MRIYSNFRDYYDIGLGLGHAADDDIVYVRETRGVPMDLQWLRNACHFGLSPRVLGFCGRLKLMFIGDAFYIGDDRPRAFRDMFLYSFEEVAEYVERYNANRYNHRKLDFASRAQRGLRQAFEACARGVDEPVPFLIRPRPWSQLARVFADHNCPIFAAAVYEDCEQDRVVLDPMLRAYDFARIVPPYEAWQELSMFIGGVLRQPVNPIPLIPDETMAEIKGFDEWSFRKSPREKT